MDDLKAKLASQEVELKSKNEAADKLIQIVGRETETVTKEKNIGNSSHTSAQRRSPLFFFFLF